MYLGPSGGKVRITVWETILFLGGKLVVGKTFPRKPAWHLTIHFGREAAIV